MRAEPAYAAAADPMRPERWRVAAVTDETPGVRSLALVPVDGPARPFAPGQFDMLWAFGVGEAAISVSGAPGDSARPRVHTVRAVGAVTRALTRLAPGAMLGLRGPFGAGWPVAAQAGRHLLLVAGGLGLAPLRPAALAALARRAEFASLTLVAGARAPEHVLYGEALAGWPAAGLRTLVTVDAAGRGWTGRVGAVTKALPEALAGRDPCDVSAFLCGPEVMMRVAAGALIAAGLAPESLWLSLERNMKCALGQCGRCQFGPDFVCRDGPVLRYDRIAARLRVREL